MYARIKSLKFRTQIFDSFMNEQYYILYIIYLCRIYFYAGEEERTKNEKKYHSNQIEGLSIPIHTLVE